MKKKHVFCWLIAGGAITLLMSCSFAVAADRVVVVPLGGAVGDATVSDVVKGKTFSSKKGKGLTGTLDPIAASTGNATPADVLAGKTFSNGTGISLTGAMEMPPCSQSFTNSIGMTFSLIPAGTFTMGSPDGSGSEPAEPGRYPSETQHEVTLSKSYYMQTTEVTNKQWNTIIFDTSLGAKPSQSHMGDNYPVETVNWFEAAYFANRLSVVEGRTPCYTLTGCNGNVPGADMECDPDVGISETCTGYSLPTEAQWEYAARATTTTAYANPVYFDATDTEIGSGFNANLHAMGWYIYNRAMDNDATGGTGTAYEDGTKPVAAKQANRWGLYDMHGNVYEWCRDWWDGTTYSSDPVSNPTGDATGSSRVIRGGSWSSIAGNVRSAYRYRITPGFRSGLGFRLVLPPGQ
jgi:formylglycine-generating enzyme required for sulfatase activity